MKMNASLFPYRCDVSSPVSLVSVPGRAFSMRQSLSAGWVMDTFIDEATKRDSQHRSPNHLTLDRILSKDPDSPVKPVMESEISVRPGHNIDRGPSYVMSTLAVIWLVPAPPVQPLIGPRSCSQHLRGMPGMISVMWAMRAALIPSI